MNDDIDLLSDLGQLSHLISSPCSEWTAISVGISFVELQYHEYNILWKLVTRRAKSILRKCSISPICRSEVSLHIIAALAIPNRINNLKLCFKNIEFIIIGMILFFFRCMSDFDSNKNNYLQQKRSEDDSFNIKKKELFYQTSVLRTSTSLPPNSALVVTEPSS
jgi:hypothetical protein